MPLDLPREKEPSNLIESIEAGCVFLILNFVFCMWTAWKLDIHLYIFIIHIFFENGPIRGTGGDQ